MVDAASQSTTRPTEAVKTNPSHFDPFDAPEPARFLRFT